VFAQNHDQIGNRMLGERLSTVVAFEAQKLAAAAVLLSPFVPLLFMGEEYGETAPFLYLVSHGDPDLVAAVRDGRAREFESFGWRGEPPTDPQAEETFERSRLRRDLRAHPSHAALLDFHRELLRLRREVPALASLDRDRTAAIVDAEAPNMLRVHRGTGQDEALVLLNLGPEQARPRVDVTPWKLVLDTGDARWGGSAAARIGQDGRPMLPGHGVLVLHRALDP
jgi:maltooligosyltrehalose trehalohydrolase